MAILFNKTVDFDKWILSENNIILDFYDDTTRVPATCNVIYNSETLQTLYPHPDGTFKTNLKDYLNTFVRDYNDDLEVSDLTITDINTFLFDWTKVINTNSLELTITFDDNQQETIIFNTDLLLGNEQLLEYKKGFTIEAKDNFVLSPLKEGTTNRVFLKYWNGYPFDFGFIIKALDSGDVQIKNFTNSVTSTNINTSNKSNRLFLSNGDTNQTLENFIPFVLGYNNLEIFEQGIVNKSISFIDLWKIESDCGVYLKWLNQYGSYSYWLFNKNYSHNSSAQNLGIINNDFDNLKDTISQSKSLGIETSSSFEILADDLNADESNFLKHILNSPKVYLFMGERFTTNTFNKWLEVTISNNNQELRDFKGNLPEFRLNIDLPNNYNTKL